MVIVYQEQLDLLFFMNIQVLLNNYPQIENSLFSYSLKYFFRPEFLQLRHQKYQQLIKPIISMLKTKLTQPKNTTLAFSIGKAFKKVIKILPSIISSPIKLINLILRPLNLFIEIVLFIILIIQTVHVLSSKQKRYLNIRHLLIKWIFFLLILLLAEHINKHTVFDQVFILLCNCLAAVMVYPSNVIKNLHLKYFSYSQKKKFDQSIDDPTTFQISLTSRILVSLATFFLSVSRLIITFIPLQNRKKVEESIKEVNMTIVQEKYFGKIYDSNWRKGYDNQIIGQSLEESVNSGKNTKEKSDRKSEEKSVKARGETCIKAKVDQYIEINLGLIVSSEQGHRKFTFYRSIQISYNAETSQLTITNQQDFRSSTILLSQIVIIDDLMIQLISEEDQQTIFVRFRVKSEKELFINSVYLQS